jgi:hypothetical protein
MLLYRTCGYLYLLLFAGEITRPYSDARPKPIHIFHDNPVNQYIGSGVAADSNHHGGELAVW